VGYRKFQPIERLSADIGRVVGSIDLAHTFAGAVRSSVQVERSLVQSFRLTEPYLTSTQANGSIVTRLSSAWEITATAGQQWLDHRAIDAPSIPSVEQVEQVAFDIGASFDAVRRYTIGAAHRGRGATIALTADYSRLHSNIRDHQYNRLRLVTSIARHF
jgi:hypothetical protein